MMKTIQISIIALFASFFFLTETYAQNLLQNSSFDQVNHKGPISHFHRNQTHVGGGQSGAHAWTTWANTMGSTIETELMPSTLTGGHMLRVSTNGIGNGIVQTWGRIHEGHEEATACVWIFIERGKVGVGLGNRGNTHISMVLIEPGKWERIMVSNGVAPVNQIIIYTDDKQGADFYIESADVYPGPPMEVECCRPE